MAMTVHCYGNGCALLELLGLLHGYMKFLEITNVKTSMHLYIVIFFHSFFLISPMAVEGYQSHWRGLQAFLSLCLSVP